MNYTSEMEKAMHQAHGISYEVYRSNVEARMKVEQKREQDYVKGKLLIARLDSKVHSI
ncbi:hypothetical protein IM538_20355 [Cytobacillus suaedae]|nr:hypothetical protein IM538_20355 [Cytobacillus suaedae]